MANVNVDSEAHVLFGTHSHGEEGLATRSDTYPAQLCWSDLHPPGVTVLPKGSPPAGAGEINWEDTLGGKFALAMEKLEGLLYAVFGSRPHAEPDGETGWIKRQWYDRQHPRCLWAPEMWERHLLDLFGLYGCGVEGDCWDYQAIGKEYAALGESPPCCPMPVPQVPIRTQSGDPAAQFAGGVHDRTYFPLGSVGRNHDNWPFDPDGSGWFGATQPGRQDGVGYTEKHGDTVTFIYSKPADIGDPDRVILHHRARPSDGAWGAWSDIDMVGGPFEYTAQLGPYPHGTQMQWYIEVRRAEDPAYTRYDPGGESAPVGDDAYSLVWFTHFNPYGSGLPEMLDDVDGVDIRHGTDHYRFDGSETIQPELINMARWVLSWLGRDCCGREYETCAETDKRTVAIHHNPRFRGGDDGLCCTPMPVRFRWSGSNVHPHYRTGGKGDGTDTLDTRPLTNHPDELSAGSQAARKTWRGLNMLFAEKFDNPYYGGGYSWGTAPGTFVLMYHPTWHEEARVYSKYPSWGLRHGDVIEAVHVQEIIDAVDYLVNYGIWTTTPICTRKRTPDGFMGNDCGYHRTIGYQDCSGNNGAEYRKACQRCCANNAACGSSQRQLGYWYHQWGPGYDDRWEQFPDTCEPHEPPTWQSCMDNCQHNKCHMMTRRKSFSQYSPLTTPDCPCERRLWEDTVCDGYDFFGSLGGHEASPGCGYHRDEKGCTSWDWDAMKCVDDPHKGHHCVRRVEGFSYYACTPGPCRNGFDDQHGGGFTKYRVDHEWCHNDDCTGLWLVPTGPAGGSFSGNCHGDIFGCGEIYPLGPDEGLWFHEVTGVHWSGLVPSWFEGCDHMLDCSSTCDFGETMALPPEVPGYGYHNAAGTPFCEQYHESRAGCFSAWAGTACCEGHMCQCDLGDFPVCLGEEAWVAVDLNLDGTGRPYCHFRGRNGDLPVYEGRGVPVLRDYDLTLDPETWSHDCPCETWTGGSPCAT